MRPPTIVLIPGATLLDITPTSYGVTVRCPGCEHVQHFTTSTGTRHATFLHEDDCPVHARILHAIATYERDTVRRG